jgi:cation diffusion facilitator CzcD-associated flavoprotein CzcO
MKSPVKIERVVIVGAGLSGLTAAYYLRERGIDPLLLDRAEVVGSSWRARHPQLSLNTHRSVSHLPGFKYPAKTSAFPKRDDVVRHLEDFARQHAFRVSHGKDVTSIRHLNSRYEIEVGENKVVADNVVIASGRDNQPGELRIEGIESFQGTHLHAAAFGDAKQYVGKGVLVVGGGNSGFDVVNHLSRVRTANVWLSVRSGSNILPKRLKGIAVHRFSPLMERLPIWASDAGIRIAERIAFGDLRKVGLPIPSMGAATRLRREQIAIPVDDGAIQSMKDGRTVVVAEVLRIEGAKVYFADGRIEEPEYLINATGYSTGLTQMLSSLCTLDDRGNFRVDEQYVANHSPGLFFVGMKPSLVSYFDNAGREARSLANAIIRRPYLPHSVEGAAGP